MFIKSNFNWVNMPIGLFGSSKTSDYVNKRVSFNMEFYDILEDIDIQEEEEKEDNTITEKKILYK